MNTKGHITPDTAGPAKEPGGMQPRWFHIKNQDIFQNPGLLRCKRPLRDQSGSRAPARLTSWASNQWLPPSQETPAPNFALKNPDLFGIFEH